MDVGAADVLRDWVVAIGAAEDFCAGAVDADPFCLGGSLGGLRFSSVVSAFEGAIEGLRDASEGLPSELVAGGLSSVFFGGNFAGCFLG